MGTRCNIRVEYGGSIIYIYRHWDGYPSETGVDIFRKLCAHPAEPHEFVKALLTAKREGDDPLPQYELTNNWHGDIEYAYFIRFPSRQLPEFSWVEVSDSRKIAPPNYRQLAAVAAELNDIIGLDNSRRLAVLTQRGRADQYKAIPLIEVPS